MICGTGCTVLVSSSDIDLTLQIIGGRADKELGGTLMMRPYPAPRPLALILTVFGLSALGELSAQPVLLETTSRLSTGDVPEVIQSGDIQGDGHLDIAVAATGTEGGLDGSALFVYLGRGGGAFERVGPFRTGLRPEGLVLAKLDGDLVLDAATANFGDSTVSIFFGAIDGRLSPPLTLGVPGGPRAIVSADFDRDTYPDLATANYTGNSVSIIKGVGNGGFVLVNTYPAGAGPEGLVVLRLNADPFPDLLTADNRGNTLTPLAGGPGGVFTPWALHGVGLLPRFVVATDLDSNGLDDAIVANTGSHAVSMERNTGSGFIFTNFLPKDIPDLTLEEPVFLALADMNGDGSRDVLTSWTGSDVVTIHFRAPGDFLFAGVYPIQTGDTPLGILGADLNGDGGTDIAVSAGKEDKLDVFATYRGTPGLVLDNDAPNTSQLGPWSPSGTPYAYGSDSLFSKNGARFVWTAPVTGVQEVCLWWTVTANRSTVVPVEVTHRGGVSTVLVNQRSGLGVWRCIGAFDFDGTATVAVTAPLDNDSVSADAIRFRAAASGAPVPTASARVVSGEKPRNTRIEPNRYAAFQGTFRIEGTAAAQEWVSASFSPKGEGEESADVSVWSLLVDSNGNGRADPGDREIGEAGALESDARVLTFTGFSQPVAPGADMRFFVVADIIPPPSPTPPVAGAMGGGAGKAVFLGLSGAVLLAGLSWSRRGRLRAVLGSCVAVCLLSIPVLLGSGCGGGGGGGGPGGGGTPEPPEPQEPARIENLKIELTSLGVRERDTGLPASIQGLPAVGWSF